MSVYVDQLMIWGGPTAPGCFQGRASCHLYADTLAELHSMAAAIGMKPQWFQGQKVEFPHYDLTGSRRDHALKLGAISTDRYHLIEFVRRNRAQIKTQTEQPV